MKSFKHFLFSICLLSILVIACQTTPKPIHISGVLENTELEKVKLYNDFHDFELDVTDGTFNTTFEADEPMYMNLRVGRKLASIFVVPGQNLDIQYNGKSDGVSFTFSGDDSQASAYLAAKDANEEVISGEALYKMEETDFLNQLKMNEDIGLKSLSSAEGLTKSFIEAEKVNIQFGQHMNRLNYEPAHAYYAKKEDFKPSEDFMTQINSINLNNEKHIGISSFGGYLTSYISNNAYRKSLDDEKYSGESDPIIKASIDMIDNKIKNEKVKGYAIDKIIKQHLSYSSALGLADYMTDIKDMTSNANTFTLIDESMDKWGHLAKGKPAPEFDGMTLKGQPVKLSDLKGKNVYIDVWATWCGPCIGEQPALFELEKKYHGNDKLAFVGVSIDSDKEAWEKMVAEKEMKGEQIFTDGAWKSDICTSYLINGIPRFILVDQNGNIIDSDAPRPSSEEIKRILKELSGEPLLSSL